MKFQCDTASRTPIYRQLADQVRRAVARGNLKAGERLPSVRQLSRDLVTFLPRALSAAIVLIMGNIVGALAETGVERSLGHVSPELRRRVPSLVKYGVTGFAVIIAANQLGIDTTIITVAVAAIFAIAEQPAVSQNVQCGLDRCLW